MKATNPEQAAQIKNGVKMAGKAAKYGAKKAYNVAKYAMGGVAKRKYL